MLGARFDAKRHSKETQLFVGNLDDTVTEWEPCAGGDAHGRRLDLHKFFSAFGVVVRIDVVVHRAGPLKGKTRGFGFVEFQTAHEARTAVEQGHDKQLRGRPLTVKKASVRPFTCWCC